MCARTSRVTDEQLVSLIGGDARLSAEKLSKKLKMSPTTVRRRLKAATRKGIIRTVPLIDPAKAGLHVQVLFGFNVSRNDLDSTLKALEGHTEIKWLAIVTGGYDIMARAAFGSVEELSSFLRDRISEIKGIKKAESFLCLDVAKGRFISPG